MDSKIESLMDDLVSTISDKHTSGMRLVVKDREELAYLKENTPKSLQYIAGGFIRQSVINKIDLSSTADLMSMLVMEFTKLKLSHEELRKDHEKLRVAYTMMIDSKLDEN